MKTFQRICHMMTIGGAIIAAYILWYTVAESNNVMQESAGAAFACAVTVIPYCFARAVEQLAGR